MKDRVPTQILPNGAIRYAVYDAGGNFLRYDYMLPADNPSEEGTPLNKANLFRDTTALALGLPTTAVPDEGFAKLSAAALIRQTGVSPNFRNTAETVLGQKIGDFVHVGQFEYVGTGAFGASNPNVVVTGFRPDLVIVQNLGASTVRAYPWARPAAFGVSASSTNLVVELPLSWGSDRVSWYYTGNAVQQYNVAGNRYIVTAFGLTT
jgi:hypothetical protein